MQKPSTSDINIFFIYSASTNLMSDFFTKKQIYINGATETTTTNYHHEPVDSTPKFTNLLLYFRKGYQKKLYIIDYKTC